MKIYLANSSNQQIGGGWTFISNFKKAMDEDITENYDEATHYFISGATMVSRDEVEKAKQDGKKIVLRIDNAVRNSRNRNTGMSRMKDFASWADLVVYQSEWAWDYLSPFLGGKGVVILNSVDLDVFYPPKTFHLERDNNFLYARFNRDETKNWEVARYWFSWKSRQPNYENSKLIIVGNFSPELLEGNFDFYADEQYQFMGVQSQEAMADIYRNSKWFIYTYYNDACSNTLIEALVSGCRVVGDKYYRHTGGAYEIIRNFKEHGREYFDLSRMAKEYRECLRAID